MRIEEFSSYHASGFQFWVLYRSPADCWGDTGAGFPWGACQGCRGHGAAQSPAAVVLPTQWLFIRRWQQNLTNHNICYPILLLSEGQGQCETSAGVWFDPSSFFSCPRWGHIRSLFHRYWMQRAVSSLVLHLYQEDKGLIQTSVLWLECPCVGWSILCGTT